MGKPLKAYRVQTDGFDDGIVLTETAGKARYVTLLSAWDASYDLTFADVRVVRAPEYDSYDLEAHYCITEKHIWATNLPLTEES